MTLNGTIAATLNDDFYDFIKNSLDPVLVNNPKFMEVLSKELKYVRYKTNSEDFYVYTSPNKDSVTIISSKPLYDCTIKQLGGQNASFIYIVIRLNGEDMYDEYSQGVLFDREQVEEHGMKTVAHYETKFETTYFLSCYTKEGIEFSNSSYSDSYPLNKKRKDVDLRDQVLSSFHKPVFMESALPKPPIHILRAKARNTYRKRNDVSIIHTNLATMTPRGYEDVLCSLHAVHPLFPDMLRGSNLIAKSVEQDGRYIFVPEETYAPSVEAGYKRAKRETKMNLEQSKENINEAVYNYLINNI